MRKCNQTAEYPNDFVSNVLNSDSKDVANSSKACDALPRYIGILEGLIRGRFTYHLKYHG